MYPQRFVAICVFRFSSIYALLHPGDYRRVSNGFRTFLVVDCINRCELERFKLSDEYSNQPMAIYCAIWITRVMHRTSIKMGKLFEIIVYGTIILSTPHEINCQWMAHIRSKNAEKLKSTEKMPSRPVCRTTYADKRTMADKKKPDAVCVAIKGNAYVSFNGRCGFTCAATG